MKKIIYLLVLTLVTSCDMSNSNQKTLEESTELSQIFNNDEIDDLQKIVTFFDNQIMNSFKSENIVDSYNKFNMKDLELKEKGLIFGNVDFLMQQELYNSINKSTFDEIWNLGKSTNEKGEARNIVFINPLGKYAKYLHILGARNRFIKNYIETMESSYDISPSLLYVMTDNYRKLDISDESIRLMIAIHYLTLNDNQHE